MNIIFVTGAIASGKSTAVNMLRNRHITHHNHVKCEFIDLDVVTNNAVEQDAVLRKNIDDFLKSHGYRDTNTIREFVLTNIFTDYSLYDEYVALFEPMLNIFLTELRRDASTLYIVEASALYAYPSLGNFGLTIEIIKDAALRKVNASQRGVSHNDYETISALFKRNKVIYNNTNSRALEVYTDNDTLLELRGKFEVALISHLTYIQSFTDDSRVCVYGEAVIMLNDIAEREWNGNVCFNKDYARCILTDLMLRTKLTQEIAYAVIFQHVGRKASNTDKQNELIAQSKAFKIANLTTKDRGVKKLICMFGNHCFNVNNDSYNETFFEANLSHFTRTQAEIFEIEQLAFKECEYDWIQYKMQRINYYRNLIKIVRDDSIRSGLQIAIEFCVSFVPKIGWFCGTFDPYTVGHHDIVVKAQRMFDKVVLVSSINPTKNVRNVKKPENVKIEFKRVNSIPEAVLEANYEPILIRGIRNTTDYCDAQLWYSQINEALSMFDREVDCVMINADPMIAHVSSSYVRQLQKSDNVKLKELANLLVM